MHTGQALEAPDQPDLHFHPILKGISHVLSVVFHPLFIPLIGAWLVMETHPVLFAGFGDKATFRLYASVASNMVVLTGFTVLILKLVGFIQSIRLRTRRDRVIPYIATMTFYFWAFLVLKHQAEIPVVLTAFILGSFLAVALAFVSNLYIKVSMHMLGMGGLLGLMLCFFGDRYFNIALPLIVIILLSGMIGTSRLILGEHSLREVYLGYLLGAIAQLAAAWVLY